MEIMPYPADDEKQEKVNKKPMKKSDFSQATSVILWTLRFLGCLPDFRKSPLSIMLILYSATLLGGNVYLVQKYFSPEPMENYTSLLGNFSMRSHEKFYLEAAARANFVYMPLIQILYCLCARNIYSHINDWIKFEKLYYELTSERLFPTLRKKAFLYHLLVTILNIILVYIQYDKYLNSQVRPELAVIFFCLLRYTDVLFLILMKAGAISAIRLSELYMQGFNELKVLPCRTQTNELPKYEALWLKLSELIRGTGKALASVLFVHIVRYVVLGLFFSYLFWVRLLVLLQDSEIQILLGWGIEILVTYFFIWILTTFAFETQLQMTDLVDKLRHELNENENNPKFCEELVDQVTSFQETVTVLPPKVKLLDYFSIDRHLLFTIVQLYLTYLIILVQFKIAEYSIKGAHQL